ncbi:SUMF1/EgtB/PvdO family nonheme iron enzyme [bacterium]|nr:SUMF1/EgtB/PvdO family nonheme iron enzyme [bacterium]
MTRIRPPMIQRAAAVALLAGLAALSGCTEDDTIVSVNFESGPIDDLTVTATTPTSATLVWSAPSAGGTTAEGYRIRYGVGSLAPGTWDEAVVMPDPPPPNVPDSTDVYWAVDLPPGETLAFAVRYTQGNGVSELSNVATVTMPGAPAIPDDCILVPAGTFVMGSPPDEFRRDEDEAQHEVTLTRAFFIGRHEVTQGQYEDLMGENPSQRQGPTVPVENVSFLDAVRYCNARSLADGLAPAYTIEGETVSWDRDAGGWRLPTEAEWEYACRAGSDSSLPNGDITETACNLDFLLDQYGVYCGNDDEDDEGVGGPSPVMGRRNNAWGLYDVHGNVFEWCWDWYASDPPRVDDPAGPVTGVNRVIRGGGWTSQAQACRAANRSQLAPSSLNPAVGFRVARNVP